MGQGMAGQHRLPQPLSSLPSPPAPLLIHTPLQEVPLDFPPQDDLTDYACLLHVPFRVLYT